METQLDYLDRTDLSVSAATVVGIVEVEGSPALVLDRTIFYPQGGGQPSDTGTIRAQDASFAVTKAVVEGDRVIHMGSWHGGGAGPGTPVDLEIDPARRQLHARLHTAGHVVMAAAHRSNGLLATKGYHFPDGPYVEFSDTVADAERAAFVSAVSEEVERMLQSATAVTSSYSSVADLETAGVHLPPGVPDGRVRVVSTDGYASPCGGTHVASLDQIGSISIRGVKYKSGRTKVSYEIGEAGTEAG